jgi:hypothetical protein
MADEPSVLRWFYIGVGCVLAASLVYLESVRRTGREPGDWVGEASSLSLPELRPARQGPPVLVFQVATAEAVASVRAVVAPERVVVETPGGFALREGRIVAAGHDVIATLLTETGWSDRPLEIHRAEPRLPDYRSHGPFAAGAGKTRSPADALAHKSHLTPAEAMAVLESLE